MLKGEDCRERKVIRWLKVLATEFAKRIVLDGASLNLIVVITFPAVEKHLSGATDVATIQKTYGKTTCRIANPFCSWTVVKTFTENAYFFY